MKRDDLTAFGGGGNKVRKLEFLMAEALSADADTVLTPGSPQSNHCRLTAAAAAACGLACELFLSAPGEGFSLVYHRSGNRFLFDLFGAASHVLPPGVETLSAMEARADALRAAGQRPFIIPLGGSNAVGCLGYVAAAQELDCVGFDVTVAATGSGGTLAGLIVGNAPRRFSRRIFGVSVGRPEEAQRALVQELVRACAEVAPSSATDHPVTIFDRARGPGYGRADVATLDAVRQAARRDGLLLDPVYTGKAMAGLIELVRSGAIAQGAKVLFWHSGGAPALFAYQDDLEEETRHA